MVRRGHANAPLVWLIVFACLFPASAGEDTAASRYETALTAYREGRFEDAVATLDGPGLNAGERNLLGWALLQAGRRERAIEAFGRSIDLERDAHDSLCGLGFAYLRSAEYDTALEYFDLAAEGDPGPECARGRETARAGAAATPRSVETEPQPAVDYVARGNYFWRRAGESPFENLYVKGVNLSFARPGKHITEFPRDAGVYREWFGLVREMRANVIRVYTILPPEFYQALRDFNSGRELEERLLLVQGIWAELPEGSRFRDPSYMSRVQEEIRSAVDVVHGRARIEHRYGHAHGDYDADVSNHVLAFIFGREWEPSAVSRFHTIDATRRFRGEYLAIEAANPMEAWLTEMLDGLIGYELSTYGAQRPVAWMSWPTLDALHHPSEATFEESLPFRKGTGETDIGIPPDDEIYDDDAFTLDETKLVSTRLFRAGVFASHHVYPYYPDFMRNERRYAEAEGGRYRAYLDELKGHYRDIPLLVSEYGVPTSRAVGRYHPEGLDHGGHSEQRQAAALERMTNDIRAAGCAGGIVFSWIDEWVKRNWMVAGTEARDHRWYNAMDPEESYGLLAMLPADREKVRGNPGAWEMGTLLETGGRTAAPAGAQRLGRLFVDSDAGYVYVRLDVGGPIDWNETAYLLAIDTYGDEEGDHKLPLGLGVSSEVGIEFAVVIHGDESRVLIDDRYNRTRFAEIVRRQEGRSGWEFHDDYHLEFNDDGRFSRMIFPHGRRFGRDGTIYPEGIYDASAFRHGNLDEDTTADWLYTPAANMIELRIPWGLLSVSDPSSHQVLVAPGEHAVTPGLRLRAFSYRPGPAGDGAVVLDALPPAPDEMATYNWSAWDEPQHASHLKAAYHTLQETFGSLETPSGEWNALPQLDFTGVIENHYASLEEFFALPAVKAALSIQGDDLYGSAMAHLTVGIVRGERFHLHEASHLLRTLLGESDDPRLLKASRAGLDHIRGLLAGRIATGDVSTDDVRRVEIKALRAPRKRFDTITLGRSAIHLPDGARVRTQVDRVTRDWLSGMNFTDAPASFSVDRVVPWHEGSRTRDLIAFAAIDAEPVWGTHARRFGDRWFTPDADGEFRFEVTADKVYGYPTNLFMDEANVWINDTHGISALAWDASDADLVIGCGDHVGKADAAYDLASRGVNVYMPTDRFLYTLIGAKTKGTVLGSAPIRDTQEGAVLGDQAVTFRVDESIVVSNTTGRYPLQYYDAPYRYFTALAEYARVQLDLTAVDIPEYGGAGAVVERARELGAKLIGIRVATLEEHDAVAAWLAEDPANRAILFHSAVYPDGYRLFAEFPEQTSFGDVRPEFGG